MTNLMNVKTHDFTYFSNKIIKKFYYLIFIIRIIFFIGFMIIDLTKLLRHILKN